LTPARRLPLIAILPLALGLPASALALGLSVLPASRFPVGSYDSDAYTLTFDTTGTFRYVRGDDLMVQGQYVVHDSTVSLTDEEGRDACTGAGRNPGTYRWKLVGSTLWFRTVHDPCPDRIRGLADQAWRPHHAR
jgi:hypothetical protein